MEKLRVTSGNPEASHEVGRWLGARAAAGDVLLLEGELGAGKTLLTKGVASGLGIDPDRVTSPSFTLVQVHRGRLPLFHVDLYRLGCPAEIEALGLEEMLEDDGVAVVEWAPRLPPFLRPAENLWIRMEVRTPTERELHLRATGARMTRLLDEMGAWLEETGKGSR